MKIFALWLAAFVTAAYPADVTQGGFGAARSSPPQKTATSTKPSSKPATSATAAKSAASKPAETKSKRTTYPFHGTLDSVDPGKNILVLRGKQKNRVILLSAKTRIDKSGARAKLQDGIPGERVSGSVMRNSEGKEEALTVHFGPKPAGALNAGSRGRTQRAANRSF